MKGLNRREVDAAAADKLRKVLPCGGILEQGKHCKKKDSFSKIYFEKINFKINFIIILF